MKQKHWIILSLIMLIFAGFLLLVNDSSKKTSINNKQAAPLPKEVTVTLDKDGFKPSTVTVKTGTAVRWKNISGDRQTVNSDAYPTNQLHKELNFGIFNSGSSVVYIFKTSGIYGYHNQLHHEQTGEVIVTK